MQDSYNLIVTADTGIKFIVSNTIHNDSNEPITIKEIAYAYAYQNSSASEISIPDCQSDVFLLTRDVLSVPLTLEVGEKITVSLELNLPTQ